MCKENTEIPRQNATDYTGSYFTPHTSYVPCPVMLPIFLDVPVHTFIVLPHVSNKTELQQELERLVIWKPQALQDFCGRMTHHQVILKLPERYMVLRKTRNLITLHAELCLADVSDNTSSHSLTAT
jgi:hypothetical protein